MFKILEKIQKLKNPWQIIIFVSLLFLVVIIFSQKIELSAVDLGRHLENGRLVFENKDVLFKNFYSYTEPEGRFINHHWLYGVIIYGVYLIGGFKLLSVFNILLVLLTFSLFFLLGKKKAGFLIPAVISIPVIFLLSERVEIRPEIFSYLFLAVTWLLLENKQLSRKRRLFILIPFFILWANIHIYFFIGLALIFFKLFSNFLSEFLLQTGRFIVRVKESFKKIRIKFFDFLIIISACLLTPNHVWGLLYPLNIFKNYGYQVAENKSIFFLDDLILNYNFNIFKLLLLLLIVSLIANLFFSKKNWLNLSFGFFVAALALFASRNLALFGLVALVLISRSLITPTKFIFDKIGILYPQALGLMQKYIFPLLFCFIFFIVIFFIGDYNNRQQFVKNSFGWGLSDGSLDSFQFFKDTGLSGPIFNNYDSGSALIFGLAKQEKVFVDNRPEAYSNNFFTEIYLPMQNNPVKWKEYLDKYQFETVYFSYADSTPWGKSFLNNILNDADWSLIYFDRYFVILARKDKISAEILGKYEINTWNFRSHLRELSKISDLKARFSLADLAQAYGQPDLAEEIYRQILIDKPQNNQVLFNFAYLYANSSDRSALLKSIVYFDRALKEEKRMPGAFDGLALVYWQLNDYQKAEYYWQKQQRVNKHDTSAAYYLNQVEILKKQGKLPRN